MPKYQLDLYVTGQTPRSLRAAANLRRICDQSLGMDGTAYELRLIDVQQHPELAEAAHIFATPATIRVAPLPVYRVIGDLSDPAKVLAALGIGFDDADPAPKEDLR
jgi:circadian clock protein KaiB